MLPRPTIEAFDRNLVGLGLRFKGVVIGGSALGLMGVIQRPTRDFDILVPELPPAIASAARDFAKAQRDAGVDLLDDWLNNGPSQLGDVLPAGWRERVERIFFGTSPPAQHARQARPPEEQAVRALRPRHRSAGLHRARADCGGAGRVHPVACVARRQRAVAWSCARDGL